MSRHLDLDAWMAKVEEILADPDLPVSSQEMVEYLRAASAARASARAAAVRALRD